MDQSKDAGDQLEVAAGGLEFVFRAVRRWLPTRRCGGNGSGGHRPEEKPGSTSGGLDRLPQRRARKGKLPLRPIRQRTELIGEPCQGLGVVAHRRAGHEKAGHLVDEPPLSTWGRPDEDEAGHAGLHRVGVGALRHPGVRAWLYRDPTLHVSQGTRPRFAKGWLDVVFAIAGSAARLNEEANITRYTYGQATWVATPPLLLATMVSLNSSASAQRRPG